MSEYEVDCYYNENEMAEKLCREFERAKVRARLLFSQTLQIDYNKDKEKDEDKIWQPAIDRALEHCESVKPKRKKLGKKDSENLKNLNDAENKPESKETLKPKKQKKDNRTKNKEKKNNVKAEIILQSKDLKPQKHASKSELKSDKYSRRRKRGLIKNDQDAWGYIYPLAKGYRSRMLYNGDDRRRHTLGTFENFKFTFPSEEVNSGVLEKSKVLQIYKKTVGEHGYMVFLIAYGNEKFRLDDEPMQSCTPYQVKGGETVFRKREPLFAIYLTPDHKDLYKKSNFLAVHSILGKIESDVFSTTSSGFSFLNLKPAIITQFPIKDLPKDRVEDIKKLKTLTSEFVYFPQNMSINKSRISYALPYAPWVTLKKSMKYVKTMLKRSLFLILYQLISGADFLHENGCYHGNLNPSNVLMLTLNQDPIVKITSIGKPYINVNGEKTKFNFEDLFYQPPSVVNHVKESRNFKLKNFYDIFGIGMIAYEFWKKNFINNRELSSFEVLETIQNQVVEDVNKRAVFCDYYKTVKEMIYCEENSITCRYFLRLTELKYFTDLHKIFYKYYDQNKL